MSCPGVSYRPRHEATPKVEGRALAAVYRLVLDCHAEKKGGPATAPEDARKDKNAGIHSDCT